MALEFASRDCRYEQVLLLCRGTSEHADAPGRDLVDGNWIELERTDFGCRIVGEAQNSLLHLIIFSLNYGLGPFLLKLWGEPVTVSASLTVWSNKQGEVGKIDENWAEAESKMVGCESDCDGLILAMFVSCFFRLCLCLLWQCLKSFSLFSVIVVVVPHPSFLVSCLDHPEFECHISIWPWRQDAQLEIFVYRHEMDAKIDLSKRQSDKSGVFNWDDAQSNDVLMHSFTIQWLRSLEVLFFWIIFLALMVQKFCPNLKVGFREGGPVGLGCGRGLIQRSFLSREETSRL